MSMSTTTTLKRIRSLRSSRRAANVIGTHNTRSTVLLSLSNVPMKLRRELVTEGIELTRASRSLLRLFPQMEGDLLTGSVFVREGPNLSTLLRVLTRLETELSVAVRGLPFHTSNGTFLLRGASLTALRTLANEGLLGEANCTTTLSTLSPLFGSLSRSSFPWEGTVHPLLATLNGVVHTTVHSVQANHDVRTRNKGT